jgi:aminopeptidase N
VHNNFDGITYAKGASVLRQLVAWVGQDAFLAGLRTYFRKHAWGNTQLRDLLAELETASGRDLGAWAKLWLETAGVNTVAATLPDAVPGVLRQTGAPGYPSWRPQRIGVGGYSLVDGSLTRIWDTAVDLAGPETELPRLKPADLVLVNDGDLGYTKVRLDNRSLWMAGKNLGRLGDSVARAVVWGIVWDMTRDGELPAQDFVEGCLTWVAGETNSTGMQKVLDLVTLALEAYVWPEHRHGATAAAAKRLWALAVEAAPGSDAQLQLVRAFARHATDPPELDLLEELAAGSRSLTGLDLDTDLRWDLLFGLVAAGRAGEDRIDAQLAADRTNSGFERAAGARAALPNPEAKAAAWLRAVEDPATPNATQRAIIAGWARVKDAELLLPFVEPDFAALPRIWRARSPQTAATIAEGLYPSAVAHLPDAEVIEGTDRFLAELGDDLPPLRRLVVEGRAGVVRSLAAQAADRAVWN